jgi:hypothetical protein
VSLLLSNNDTGRRGVRSTWRLENVLFVLPFMLSLVLVGPLLLFRLSKGTKRAQIVNGHIYVYVYKYTFTWATIGGSGVEHIYCLGVRITWRYTNRLLSSQP